MTTIAQDLQRPHQLALDRFLRLYVADSTRGIVRIDPDGRSTVLALGVEAPYGVAVFETGSGMTIFVADERGILMARGGQEIRIPRSDRATPDSDTTEGEEPIGTPYQLAALDERTVAYTDLRGEAVRMLEFEPSVWAHGPLAGPASNLMHRRVAGAVTLLAGSPRSDASMNGGGFAEGSAALFDAPMGIASMPGGNLVVADAGNRRIRIVRGIDRGRALLEDGALPPARAADRAYRVLYVGPSLVWWDTSWPASIPGTIEQDLRAVRSHANRAVEVQAARLISADAAAYLSYLDVVADSGTIDAVVLGVNAGIGTDASTGWIAPTAAALRTIRDRLARAHMALIVAFTPTPLELDPTEQTWRKVVEDAFAPVQVDEEARWQEVVREAQVSSVDLFAVFRDDLRSAAHRPLFGSDEAHLTPYGRALTGNAIAAALARLRPWDGAPR